MAEVFPWPCSTGSVLEMEPRVITDGFGEGYAQRVPDGTNSMLENRSVQFTSLSPETADAIDQFLRARGGHESFQWTAPFQTVPRLWICAKWRVEPEDATRLRISATFTESPL